jgi:potassium-transporting ATPase KdpC subunit
MKTLLISLKIFLFFTLLTGIIYPIFVTAIAKAFFPEKANGSLIIKNNKIIGSELIGQQFDSVVYFTSRPSAISYNPLPSGGSNFGLTNSKLKQLVTERKQQFISFNQLDSLTSIPSEMLFASASGLDPHISPYAALLQVERIVKARNLNLRQQRKLKEYIQSASIQPQFGLLGVTHINVLNLNIELDKIGMDNSNNN